MCSVSLMSLHSQCPTRAYALLPAPHANGSGCELTWLSPVFALSIRRSCVPFHCMDLTSVYSCLGAKRIRFLGQGQTVSALTLTHLLSAPFSSVSQPPTAANRQAPPTANRQPPPTARSWWRRACCCLTFGLVRFVYVACCQCLPATCDVCLCNVCVRVLCACVYAYAWCVCVCVCV